MHAFTVTVELALLFMRLSGQSHICEDLIIDYSVQKSDSLTSPCQSPTRMDEELSPIHVVCLL